MRVLLVNHFPLNGSGSGVYTYEIARCLKRMGLEVALLYPENVQNPVWLGLAQGRLDPPADSYHDEDGISHYILACHDEVGLYFPSVAFNFPCFTSHPRSHQQFCTLEAEAFKAYEGLMADGLRRAIHSFKPDLLHVQHVWVAAYLASQTGLPYVVSCHGTDLMGFEAMAHHRAMATQGAQAAQGIVAISRDVYDKAQRYYDLNPSQLHLIHNGYNPERFNLKEKKLPEDLKALLPEAAKYISFAGKFTAFKGIDVLLEAASRYEPQLPQLHTLIAGDGVLKDDLVAQSQKLGLKRVHFIGHQSPEALAAIYANSQCHVVPSRGEPFGLVAVEAMASGAYVIGTQAGGLSEIITPELGKLVAPGSHEALAVAIAQVVQTGRTHLERKKSSQYAAAHYAWDMTAKRLMALYAQALQIQYSDQLV